MTAPRPGIAPQAEVDLHMHSTASDGSLPPAQVVAAARAAGLAAIALTDHDTMAGLGEAIEAADAVGIRVVPGVELSAFDGPQEIHLLALHVSRPGPLESRLEYFRAARALRAQHIIDSLNRLGLQISIDDVMTEAAGGSVGRPHVARAMIKSGAVRDSREAFDRFLGAGRAAFIPKERLEVREAIEMTHAAGAIAVWAHPGPDGRRERVEPLVQMGLDGLEVRHPGHNQEDMKRIGALADFFGMVSSGGSDWHGAREGSRTIGCMHVPSDWLARQDAAAAKRSQAEVA